MAFRSFKTLVRALALATITALPVSAAMTVEETSMVIDYNSKTIVLRDIDDGEPIFTVTAKHMPDGDTHEKIFRDNTQHDGTIFIGISPDIDEKFFSGRSMLELVMVEWESYHLTPIVRNQVGEQASVSIYSDTYPGLDQEQLENSIILSNNDAYKLLLAVMISHGKTNLPITFQQESQQEQASIR